MTARDDATQKQVDAARPDLSTWLSANAGSGKTRVLTDRVARLLLDGSSPQNILCLTYTRAAASEMQNRLFSRLGEWAMLPDEELRAALNTLGIDGHIPQDTLRQARRLFASAIETPGGLKIQTIHSFCSMLLRRFPMEAGVTPQFTEIDERSAALLHREVLEEMAENSAQDQISEMAKHLSGMDFSDLIGAILSNRALFDKRPDRQTLAVSLGADPNLTAQTVLNEVFLGNEQMLLDRLVPALRASGANDQKAAAKLQNLKIPGFAALEVLENVFLFGEKAKHPFQAKVDSFPTKSCRAKIEDISEQLNQFMLRVEAARETRLAAEVLERSAAMHGFARVFLDSYDRAKEHRGWLDYDDLIARAHKLLTNPSVAAWVLFRLDGGIDHILVDEAQDTSPLQWQVIKSLAQEFTSGQGARAGETRTIFVVGDKKQSIYSFQGADPREFDRMQQDFATRMQDTARPLQDMQLAYSFRSSPAILSTVDATFENAEASGFTSGQAHRAFHDNMPGRVDLWPVVEPPEQTEEPEWYYPVDYPAANDPQIKLANQVAAFIHECLTSGQLIPGKKRDDGTYEWRPVEPGDFLILFQRRKLMAYETIAACKRLGVPIAGVDRLKIAGELAVRDIAALLSFIATPEDNLSLAAALRSPLFGWDEAALYDLAHHRSETYLWAAMRAREADFPDTMAILRDLRNQADYLRPYELIERILTRHGGRQRLLARLGQEAEDGLDALLLQAMLYEQKSIDSLTGFLVWLQNDEVEIKRQVDETGNLVRVMTVHGAKGLEAPIVILPETAMIRRRVETQVSEVNEQALSSVASNRRPEAMRAAMRTKDDAANQENDRLLYVAMTRAEVWLIAAAAGNVGTGKTDSWYRQIEAGLSAQQSAETAHPNGKGLRYETGDWVNARSAPGLEDKTPDQANPLEDYFRHSAPTPTPKSQTIIPSDLGGAKALPGEKGADEEQAKQRGRLVHRLLEILPETAVADRTKMAETLLSSSRDKIDASLKAELLAEVSHVLDDPDLADIFAPTTLAEVPLSCNLPALGDQRIHGVIDRLIVRDDMVLAVDFKTNAVVPSVPDEVPAGLLRQMGAYVQALEQIYPGRTIRSALLWTRTATLMHLPDTLVKAALTVVGPLDVMESDA